MIDPSESEFSSIPRSVERRREPRYAPGDPKVYLGWWEGDHFRDEQVTLCNVSTLGAAVLVGHDWRVPDEVWLCAAGPGRVTWVPAKVLGREGRRVRMLFAEPIPYDVFELFV